MRTATLQSPAIVTPVNGGSARVSTAGVPEPRTVGDPLEPKVCPCATTEISTAIARKARTVTRMAAGGLCVSGRRGSGVGATVMWPLLSDDGFSIARGRGTPIAQRPPIVYALLRRPISRGADAPARRVADAGRMTTTIDTHEISLRIAQQAKPRPITEVAAELGLDDDEIELYGRYKAKVGLDAIDRRADTVDGALICVTAITPTKAGEGKTTTRHCTDRGARPAGRARRALPARALHGARFRHQGRRRGRRPRAGRADG